MNFPVIKYKLASRKLASSTLNCFSEEVEKEDLSLAVILDSDDKIRLKQFQNLKGEYNLTGTSFSVIVCAEVRNKDSENLYFSSADVDWYGNIKGSDVIKFLKRRPNVLVVFVEKVTPSIEFLVRNNQAGIKIGMDNSSELYNLSISSRLDEVEVFIKEVKKYLRILKMIA